MPPLAPLELTRFSGASLAKHGAADLRPDLQADCSLKPPAISAVFVDALTVSLMYSQPVVRALMGSQISPFPAVDSLVDAVKVAVMSSLQAFSGAVPLPQVSFGQDLLGVDAPRVLMDALPRHPELLNAYVQVMLAFSSPNVSA
mmetsp:Transcript_71610/g.155599  ORF Transcript_71610/g.155599 Transcript_71610/m.155599 type:complete len:144 (-) Transcript_71610:133-564(-)